MTKKLFRIAAALITAAALFTGCSGVFDAGQTGQTGQGVDYVTIALSDFSGARTALPGVNIGAFDHFVYKFTGTDPVVVEAVKTPLDGTPGGRFVLTAGIWTVTVEAYFTAEGGIAAQGVSAEFTVAAGQTAQAVSVVLTAGDAMTTGTGAFTYTLVYPSAATMTAFRLGDIDLTTDATETADAPSAGLTTISGAIPEKAAGYYTALVTLTNASGEAGKSDEVHIYNGQTTALNWNLSDAVFKPVITMTLDIDGDISGEGFDTVTAVQVTTGGQTMAAVVSEGIPTLWQRGSTRTRLSSRRKTPAEATLTGRFQPEPGRIAAATALVILL